MKRQLDRGSRPVLGLLLLVGLGPLVACDAFEPTWFAVDDHVALYSLSRADFVGRESAYDFIAQRPVVVEWAKIQDPYDFDVAITEVEGVLHALPAGVFDGFPIQPGIAVDSSGITFEDMDQAPRDGYVTDAALPLRTDWVYAVQTRRDFRGCTMYGKFTVTNLDPAGIVTIRAVRNPLCNDRNLVPPGS